MNNTKKALIELKNCEKYNPSFEEEFIIFRYCENNAGQENDAEDEGDDDEAEAGLIRKEAWEHLFQNRYQP